MRGNPNQTSNKNTFFVKAVSKDENKKEIDPHFAFRQKVGDEYKVVDTQKSFSGNLTAVETGTREYQGEVTPVVKLTLEDGEERYVYDAPYNISTRSVFNALLSLDSGDGVNLSIYKTKPKEAGGKSYVAMSLRQNDALVPWKYKREELPEIKKVKLKGKDISDTADIDAFYEGKLKAKFANFGGKKAVGKVAESAPEPETVSEDVNSVPF